MRFIITLLIIHSFSFCQAQAQSNGLDYANEIKLENLKTHLYTLASTEMRGRNTGEEGQKKAAQYIETFFRKNGLDSLGYTNYYQHFDQYKYSFGKTAIWYKNNYNKNSKYKTMGFWGSSYATGNIEIKDTILPFFAGYGRNLDSLNLKNNAVIILLDKNLKQTHQNIRNINKKTKARIFLVIFPKNGLYTFNPEKENIGDIEKSGNILSVMYDLKDMCLEASFRKKSLLDSLVASSINIQDSVLIKYGNYWGSKYLLGTPKPHKTFTQAKKVEKGKKTYQNPLIVDSVYTNINVHKSKIDTIRSENVLAHIEGSDKKDEVIVVSAHYDHVGARNDTTIKFGADDNASGTVAIMEIASAMQKAANSGFKPKRSIVFVAFSGEEVGLRGSHYFVQNSPYPIENTVLNFNLDMIGRNNENKEKYSKSVFLIAYGNKSGMLKRSTKKLNKKNPELKVSTHPGLGNRLTWKFSSDHYRFSRYNIPIACFFTGKHPDYHTKRDTPDKINYEKLTEITRLSYKTIWGMANTDKNLKAKFKTPKKQSFIERMMD